MNWWAAAEVITIPLAFLVGRYSRRYNVIRVKRHYRQDVGHYIRGR